MSRKTLANRLEYALENALIEAAPGSSLEDAAERIITGESELIEIHSHGTHTKWASNNTRHSAAPPPIIRPNSSDTDCIFLTARW